MKTLFLLLVTFSIGFNFYTYGQTRTKPLFNSLEFADYIKDKKGNLSVTFYTKIDSSGNIKILDNQGTSVHYYCFALADSVIEKLNATFSSKTSLKSYMVNDKLGEGRHYAGDYSFAALRGLNKKTEYLTYIYPFMSDDFHDAQQAIYDDYFIEMKKSGCKKIQIGETFFATLKQYHNKTKNLPKKELPPSQMPPPGM